jgi:hypothetical protein
MAKRVIALMGQPLQNEDAAAAAAITPGMLVSVNGSGLWIPHGTALAAAARNFAMERDEMGKDMDTPYAIGDTVKVGAFSQGMRVNALIATGVNAAVGALLESAGNGTLRVLTTGVALARALEAVNNASGSNARLRVEIL